MVTLCLAHCSLIAWKKKQQNKQEIRGRKDVTYCTYRLGFFEIPLTMNDILENAIIWDNEWLTCQSYPQYHF